MYKSGNQKGGKSYDKRKVLPTKKFPELKLMINGEQRNGPNTLSSDDEANLAVSFQNNQVIILVPPNQENSIDEPAADVKYVLLQCRCKSKYGCCWIDHANPEYVVKLLWRKS